MANKQTKNSIDIKVKIDKLLDGDSSTKAFASATIGGAFAVHDIRITEKDDKVMVNMPFRSYKSGGETKYVDTFHPITADARTALYDAVKEAYEQALEEDMANLEREGSAMSQQM